MAGHVFDTDRQVTVTNVFHVFFLPVLPLGSYILTRDTPDTATPIATCDTSIWAAFLRSWGAFVALCSALPVVLGFTALSSPLLACVGAGMLAVGWSLGRMRGLRRVRFAAYDAVTGNAVDPSLLGDQRPALRARLEAELDSAEVKFADTGSYRDTGRVHDFVARALDPATTDVSYAQKALVLARLHELDAAAHSERSEWRSRQERIAERLQRQSP